MTPELMDQGDKKNLKNNIYLFSKPGEYYLAFVANPDQTIEIKLTGNTTYTLEIIDTWNMQIVEQTSVEPGVLNYKTKIPYTALRITLD